MSKAVLIMDMPDCCAECQLSDDDPSGLYCVSADDYYDGEDGMEDRTSFCPLRELPEKIPELKSGYEEISKSIHREGWNACLNEIIGENP